MSLMEESANAELQGRPGGARRCARSAAGHKKVEPREGTVVRKERLGGRGATRGSGSISTHLNFGPSQGQYGRTTRPPRPPLSVTSSGFFFSCSRIRFSPSLFFSPAWSPFFPLPLLPCFLDGVRTALSRHTVLGPTPSPVCRRINVSFLFSRAILRSGEIPISGDTRVIGRQRIA